MKEIEKLVTEGKKKGFKCDKMLELWDKIEHYSSKVAEILKKIDSVTEVFTLD
jgi:hypothetical protein